MGNVIVASGIQITRIKDDEEDKWQALWRAGVSEFMACLIFIFIGCGSVIASKSTLGEDRVTPPGLTLIACAHGFAIMTLIYAIGEISGGHINPAITWALLITDRISIVRAFVFWISQFIGAMCGAAILYGILPESMRFHLGCHAVNAALDDWQAVGCEIVFTFIFVLVVFATAVSPFVGKIAPLGGGDYGPGKLTPFAVGATILILHLVGIPLTGASMNPARSWGPAVIRGCWDRHWVYWWGPLIGSTLAAVVAQTLFLASPTDIREMLIATRGVNFMGIQKQPLVANPQGENGSLEMEDRSQAPQLTELEEQEEEEMDQPRSTKTKDGLVHIRL